MNNSIFFSDNRFFSAPLFEWFFYPWIAIHGYRYMDEIYGKENTITYIGYDMLVEDITLDLDDRYESTFDAIYRKK